MAIGIKHAKTITIPDDPSQTERARPSDWNAEHILICFKFGTMTRPDSPEDGDAWIEASGVSPNRVVSLMVQDGGVIRTLASATF